MAKAASWPDTAEGDLRRELRQCLDQVELLEKAVAGLRRTLDEAPPNPERVTRRVGIQEQMRELTAAYAEALRRHLEGRPS